VILSGAFCSRQLEVWRQNVGGPAVVFLQSKPAGEKRNRIFFTAFSHGLLAGFAFTSRRNAPDSLALLHGLMAIVDALALKLCDAALCCWLNAVVPATEATSIRSPYGVDIRQPSRRSVACAGARRHHRNFTESATPAPFGIALGKVHHTEEAMVLLNTGAVGSVIAASA
jgi:hypothetical protein